MKHILKYIFSKKYRNSCQWHKAFNNHKMDKLDDLKQQLAKEKAKPHSKRIPFRVANIEARIAHLTKNKT